MSDSDSPSTQHARELLGLAAVRNTIRRIARWSTKSALGAEDLAGDATVAVLDPNDCPWTDPRRTFLSHMSFTVRHIWDQQMRAFSASELPDADVTDGKLSVSREPPADEELDRRRSLAILVEQGKLVVREAEALHPLAARCFDLGQEGEVRADEQARILQVPVEEVYEAHRIIIRLAKRIRAEWEQAEAARMYELRKKDEQRRREVRP